MKNCQRFALVACGQAGILYSSNLTVDRHPYLPLQMVWMGFSNWLKISLQLPFVKIAKLAPIIAVNAISVLFIMMLHCSSGSLQVSFLGRLLYAVNPVAIFVSDYHGQFDAIPALCILLAIWFFP